MASRNVTVKLQRALTGSWYAGLTRRERVIVHIFFSPGRVVYGEGQ